MYLNLCVFDLDNTLLKVNCSFKYYLYLQKKKIFSNLAILRALRYFVKFSFFSLPPSQLHLEVFERFLKGRKESEIFGKVEEFLDLYLKDFINKKISLFLKKAKKEEKYVLLLSNSPENLAVPIAKRLGIENVKATIYSKDNEGRFKSILTVMDGKNKAKHVLDLASREKFLINEIEVFTDSFWDRPLLEIASKNFVVNPDKKLYALAKAKGWKIL